MDHALLLASRVSETDNANLHTFVLGAIMFAGTGLALWLLLRYGNRGA